MGTELINKKIMDHEANNVEWELCPLADELAWWVMAYETVFFRDQPVGIPVLTFERTRVNNLGYFRLGHNDFGVKDQINLNRLYVGGPMCEVLQTLVHEMVHMWEQTYVIEEGRTVSWYHSKAFRAKMSYIGIQTDMRGHHLSVGDPFRYFLMRHGVSFEGFSEEAGTIIIQKKPVAPGKSKLRKWVCDCGQSARVGKKDFFAVCTKCAGAFRCVA